MCVPWYIFHALCWGMEDGFGNVVPVDIVLRTMQGGEPDPTEFEP